VHPVIIGGQAPRCPGPELIVGHDSIVGVSRRQLRSLLALRKSAQGNRDAGNCSGTDGLALPGGWIALQALIFGLIWKDTGKAQGLRSKGDLVPCSGVADANRSRREHSVFRLSEESSVAAPTFRAQTGRHSPKCLLGLGRRLL
jgi:hypothetical protein